MFGYNTVPAEVRNAEDRVFVIADGPLRKGDEILSIDGRGWKSTHDGLARFEAASNAENRNYMTAMCMVCSHRDTAAVELVRDGRRLTERIATRSVMDWSPYITERMLDTANIRMVADGIGYMTGVNYTKADGARIMEKFPGYEGPDRRSALLSPRVHDLRLHRPLLHAPYVAARHLACADRRTARSIP